MTDSTHLPKLPEQVAGAAPTDELEQSIINLPCIVRAKGYTPNMAFRIGHRDACHAAAELVSRSRAASAPAPGPQQPSERVSSDAKDKEIRWALLALYLVGNKLRSIGLAQDDTALINLAAAESTLRAAMAAASTGDTKEKME